MRRHCAGRGYGRRAIAGVLALGLLPLAGGASQAPGTVHEISLPKETAVFRPSPLPGYQVALQKCGICHSADYINLQPPGMTLAQWTNEMAKMQHAYGAPIDDSDIKLLGIYLTSAYGDASTVPPEATPQLPAR